MTGFLKTSLSSINIAPLNYGAIIFNKLDSETVCFTKASASTITLKSGTGASVGGTYISFLVDSAVEMPALTTGTDYAVYITTTGRVIADSNFTAPTGFTVSNSRKIGGFHYGAVSPTETVAGGSFATTGNGMLWVQADVDKLKGINQYSFWDLKFRPKCLDPRGMTYIPEGHFWVDIYFCNTEHIVNGTSKYNAVPASGTAMAKKPIELGGTGSTSYTDGTWYTFNEVVRSYGKRFLSQQEFYIAAFGVTENQSLGGAAVTIPNAIRQAGYTSKYGLEQASGHLLTWGSDIVGSIGNTWLNVNGGRGQVYGVTNASPISVLLGGRPWQCLGLRFSLLLLEQLFVEL